MRRHRGSVAGGEEQGVAPQQALWQRLRGCGKARGGPAAGHALALALALGTCGALHVPEGRAAAQLRIGRSEVHGSPWSGEARKLLPLAGHTSGPRRRKGGASEEFGGGRGAVGLLAREGGGLRGGGSTGPPPPAPAPPSEGEGNVLRWTGWRRKPNKRRKSFPVRQRLWASFTDVFTALAALEQAPGSLMRSKQDRDAMFVRQILNGILPVMAYASTSIYMVISQAYVLRNKQVKEGINYSTLLLLYQV